MPVPSLRHVFRTIVFANPPSKPHSMPIESLSNLYTNRLQKFLSTCTRVKRIFSADVSPHASLDGCSILQNHATEVVLSFPSLILQNKSLLECFPHTRRLQLIDATARLFAESGKECYKCLSIDGLMNGLLGARGLKGVKELDLNLQVPSPGDLLFKEESGRGNWLNRPGLRCLVGKVGDLEELTIRMTGPCLSEPNAYDLVSPANLMSQPGAATDRFVFWGHMGTT